MKHTIYIKGLAAVALALALSLSSFTLQAQVLTLDSCLALARKNNADIRTSQLEVLKAQEVKRQAFTKFFPQVSFSANTYYAVDPLIRFGINDIESNDMRELLQVIYEGAEMGGADFKSEMTLMKKGSSISGNFVQPLFAGGRIINGNRLASLGVDAANLMAEAKTRDVIENIESSYYLVTGLQQKVATLKAALDLIDSLDRTVQAALANGLVTNADALQVQLKRNEMLANQQQLTSGIRLSKRLLCQQIGIDYSDDIRFEEPAGGTEPPALFVNKTTGDSLRPEMKLLELNVQAEKLKKSMTIGESLPQLAIVGITFYGNILKKETSSNGIALLTLSVPLTAWWETAHKLHQHNIAIEEAQIMQDNLGRMMSLEEEKAYSDMMDAYLLMKSDSSALSVAEENYRLANLNYTAGNTTLSDVLQAHALLLQAQNAITDRKTTYTLARRRLLDLRNEK